MEIILKEDIIGLGYKNDIVNVKSGYGRNYLIPQGKGVIASESAKKILAENLKQQAHKLAALKAEAEKKAQALENKTIPHSFSTMLWANCQSCLAWDVRQPCAWLSSC